jgi:transcriptional repressor NrdR
MLCPYCNYESSKVLESRTSSEKACIRRRRECEQCGKRFTTYERVEIMPVTILKKDGSREDYSREKLFTSIKVACHKCDFSPEKIDEMIDAIENELSQLSRREVSAILIGNLILDKLKDTDNIAYLRYSSVFKDFKTVDEFISEANKLILETTTKTI